MRRRIHAVAGRRGVCQSIRALGLAVDTLHGQSLAYSKLRNPDSPRRKANPEQSYSQFMGAAQRKASNLSRINRLACERGQLFLVSYCLYCQFRTVLDLAFLQDGADIVLHGSLGQMQPLSPISVLLLPSTIRVRISFSRAVSPSRTGSFAETRGPRSRLNSSRMRAATLG